MALVELFHLSSLTIVFAIIFDLLIGDPKWLPHPIRGIGLLIWYLERQVRKLPLLSERGKGVLFFFSVTSLTTAVAMIVVYFFIFWLPIPILGDLILISLISLFYAFKGLIDAGREVERYLLIGDIESARASLISLVGRDRDLLSKRDIQKSILESYAENFNDAFIAPLFWTVLFGFPGLVFYKTVNTLDSMVGYKNEKYLHFGWFSAKMDDFLNLIPARLSALMIVIATALLLGMKTAKRSLKWIFIYAPSHPSPNAGYPESALAGALGIRLLGPAYYDRKLLHKPFIGEDLGTDLQRAIPFARKLLLLAGIIGVLVFTYLNSLKADLIIYS